VHKTNIVYWVGFPADDMIGCITSGEFTEMGEPGAPGYPNSLSDLEAKFGRITVVRPNVLDHVTGFVTDAGYRIAIIENSRVDKPTSQESIGEWVEGVS
jgi:hypothetical protein